MSTRKTGTKTLYKVIGCLGDDEAYVFLPISEHPRFDFLVQKNDDLLKIQVKHSKMVSGKIIVWLRSVWSNKSGTHVRKRERGDYDVLACFCSDTNECYFIADQEFEQKSMVTLNNPSEYTSFERAYNIWKTKRLGTVPDC